MNRRLTLFGPALLPLLACCYYGTGESSSTTSVGRTPRGETELYRAPTEFCARLEAPRPSPPPVIDDSTLDVDMRDGRVTLDADGAVAGRVLAALGEAGGESLFSKGRGAHVRIYAHVKGADREELMRSIAMAAGLVLEERGGVLEAVDPDEAVSRERRERAGSICLGPVETRLIPTEHPRKVGRVVSQIMLSCRGRIVASPTRRAVMVTDISARLDRIEALIMTLTRPVSDDGISRFQASEERRFSFGVPDHWLPSCEIDGAPAPSLSREVVRADGHAAGSLLRAIARRAGTNVVVGCGGDSPVFFNATSGQALPEVARIVGLEPIDETTFTSSGLARAVRFRRLSTQRERYEYEGRLYSTPFSEDLERVIASHEEEGLVAVAYPPNSILAVAGRVDDLDLVDRIVEAWNEPDEPATESPSESNSPTGAGES